MSSYYLVTYRPLACTRRGREAAIKFDIPLYADASCRREPDLQQPYPSITTLCRSDRFAPRLRKGDRVAYVAKKSRYEGFDEDHWRLTAILSVVETLEDHKTAAAWYRKRGQNLPSNCIVPGNRPEPLEHTDHTHDSLCDWEDDYKARAKANGAFVVCRRIFRNLKNPPILRRQDFERVFNRIPGTQNPGDVGQRDFDAICARARVASR